MCALERMTLALLFISPLQKLIEMLVKAEFPVKKRSKTSAEILTQNHCDTMKALTKSVASTVGQNEKLETEETVSVCIIIADYHIIRSKYPLLFIKPENFTR